MRNRYPKLREGPDGKMICRGCGAPVPEGRQTWCSRECYKARCPQMVLFYVHQRDKGICAECGADTEALRRSVSLHAGSDYHAIQARKKELRAQGWPGGAHRGLCGLPAAMTALAAVSRASYFRGDTPDPPSGNGGLSDSS